MKEVVYFFTVVALVVAEPPRYGSARIQSEPRFAPYPAAGFRPEVEFNLPSKQQFAPPSPPSTSYGVPDDSYAVPFNTYTAPQSEYGIVPLAKTPSKPIENNYDDSETIEAAKVTEIKKEETESKKEEPESKQKKQDNKNTEIVTEKGAYYVLLPSSELQRVQFVTENDVNNMAYTARLQYKSEDRAPIYLFTNAPKPQIQYQANAAYAMQSAQNQQNTVYGLPAMTPNQQIATVGQIQQMQAYPVPQNQYAFPGVSQDQTRSTYAVPLAPQILQQTPAVPQNQDAVPQNQYAVPQNQFAVPQNQYAVPQNQYAVPQNQYAVPQNQYAVPQNQYAVPQNQYSVPQNQYAVPQNQYSVPQTRESDQATQTQVNSSKSESEEQQDPAVSQQEYQTVTAVSRVQNPAPQNQFGFGVRTAQPGIPSAYGAPLSNAQTQETSSQFEARPNNAYGAPQGSKLQYSSRLYRF